MASVDQQLEDLMRLNADTELRFDDGGVLPANSYVLSFFSSVLRGAVEAAEAHAASRKRSSSSSASNSRSSTKVIPVQGVTKKQWLTVAPFWHPVTPPAVVKTWGEAELLLRIGSRFDLRPALDKGSEFLAANADKLTASQPARTRKCVMYEAAGIDSDMEDYWDSESEDSSDDDCSSDGGDSSSHAGPDGNEVVWKWLRFADELHLTTCLPALVKQAVKVDRAGCRVTANTQGLSAATLQQLVAELAAPVVPARSGTGFY
jgi:hypothetical protein